MFNSDLNVEIHLHFIIKILIKFIISDKLSLNTNDFEVIFREKNAVLLSRLVNNYDFKYPDLKFFVMNLFKKILMEILSEKQFKIVKVNAIIRFFSELNSEFLVQNIFPIIVLFKDLDPKITE